MKTLWITVLLGFALCTGLTLLPSRLNALTSATFAFEPEDQLLTPVRRGGFGGGGFRGGGFRGGGFAASRRVYRGGGRRYAVTRRAYGGRAVTRRTAAVGRRGAVTRRAAVTTRGRAVTRRSVTTRTAGRGVNRRTAVRSATVVRRGNWRRPGRYWWRPGAAIAAGAAIGWVAAATAASWAGDAPGPGMCWYYTNASRTNGFWDVCP
jgi:hypothetical protein